MPDFVFENLKAYVTGDAIYGYSEDTTQLTVNTNGRMVTGPQRSMGFSRADAVTCSGTGLTQAYIGATNTFTVNAQNAGRSLEIALPKSVIRTLIYKRHAHVILWWIIRQIFKMLLKNDKQVEKIVEKLNQLNLNRKVKI